MDEKTDNLNVIDNFDDMGLKKDLLRSIYSHGFEKPSNIQGKAIMPILTGSDLIAQSQSGSGKSGAFVISVLQMLEASNERYCQSLVLAPTRELAEQNYNVMNSLSQHMKVSTKLLVGGSSIYNDIERLKRGVDIVIGTPGRILDMVSKGVLKVDRLRNLTIDEADEMLSKGFHEQIYEIFREIPEDVQILLFSATMPAEILELVNKFMRHPIKILVKKEQLTLEGIKQFCVRVENNEYKYQTLCDLYESMCVSQSIIYVNKRTTVTELSDRLKADNFAVSCIHSKMHQSERNKIMKNFRAGQSRVLISTDLLARGIDIQGVSLVINYDIPFNKENYIHRIGRSGRYGRKGVAINLVSYNDIELLKKIEEFYQTQIDELPENFEQFF